MSLNPSKIDYLKHAKEILNRPGRSLNICTGCLHHESDICTIPCYAKRMVEEGVLKDSRAYPYEFQPTFHPGRIRHYGGQPKLIFLNDMSDCGGNWNWIDPRLVHLGKQPSLPPKFMAMEMVRFAELNPEHIILLLTKNPAWYGLAEWPENCKCGFTATNNNELHERFKQISDAGILPPNMWVSFEPWLDNNPPFWIIESTFIVIGGQSNPDKPISEATQKWLNDQINPPPSHITSIECSSSGRSKMLYGNRPRIFVKNNARWNGILREYPKEWKIVKEVKGKELTLL